METARADLATREESLPAETEQHEEKLKDWRAAQRAINEELAAAEAEIERLEAEIAPRDRSEFHRLLDKKRGLAVARVIQIATSYSCSACHVKIRPAALQIAQGRQRDRLLRQLQADPLLRPARLKEPALARRRLTVP